MILIQIALRNLLSHKMKSAIVGGLLVFGSILLVCGMSLLGSLDRSMAQSLVGSMSGHIQVWSAQGKDKLSLFWNPMEGTDYGQIENFAQVRKVLEGLPEVQAVVPMGIDQALVYGGNILDRKLEALRAAEKAKDLEKIHALRDHLRRIVSLMDADMKGLKEINAVDKLTPEFRQGLLDVAEGSKPAFWDSFDQDPLAHLEFLENKIAPMDLSMDMLFLRYMGTDTERFAKGFDRFEIVEGTPIPPGQRGFLFNKLWYEEWVKHKTARRLDKIKEHLDDGRTIAKDDEAQQWIKLNVGQYKEVTYQLDGPSSDVVGAALRQELGSQEQNLDKLVQAFMDMNDANFAKRYKLFYDVVAPRLMLYSVRIGDTLTLKGFTQAGYPTSANVKVYGTFRFRSLDKSTLAGGTNITDLMTWRDLYGFLTQDRKEELKQLQAQRKQGFKEVSRESAEADLFGDAAAEASPTTAPTDASPTALAGAATGGFDEFAGLDMKGSSASYGQDIARRVYTQTEVDSGVVRNAAIILKPGVDVDKAMAIVRHAIDANKLGLKAMDWREASGMVGQFLRVIYIVLAVALLVIFLVAMVIINNSLVMSTMERIREIGTMRAIGAQRSEIRWMFMVEALVMAAVFGVAGSLIGGTLMTVLGHVGIPAVNDLTVFLFAGPRLYPYLSPLHVVITLVMVTLVTVASTLYPALLAMRVTPLEAMQEAE
jgi:ABC-type lipoprotein release transport system permease subunit